MSYFIVDTWNGDGYSESGVIGHEDDHKDAMEVLYKEFIERYITSPGDFKVENRLASNGYLCYQEERGNYDSGAIHIIESHKDTHAILINPHVNSVTAINKEQFDTFIEELKEDGEFMHNLEMEGMTFNDWLLNLGSDGNNDGHGTEYFIIQITA